MYPFIEVGEVILKMVEELLERFGRAAASAGCAALLQVTGM
ncbi:hypothetical protein OIE50_50770 [Streptomyces canus]